MIIHIDYTKGKSTYRCDRCKFTLIKGVDKIYYIQVKDLNTNKVIESHHLCERDFKSLQKGLNK